MGWIDGRDRSTGATVTGLRVWTACLRRKPIWIATFDIIPPLSLLVSGISTVIHSCTYIRTYIQNGNQKEPEQSLHIILQDLHLFLLEKLKFGATGSSFHSEHWTT